ncbi:DUF4177 domain-containing protein [Shewanella sp. D64]|uniref:hypothetical protein n=1 Tax=unclassified Shewanella TaxID=196818 RepID=UPI0022BA57BB|nr:MULTISPECIES: hypothetical protein [unclassified Shewanella]MEC4725548.1 DUF4177 domain-containing protein [Shewanella sp. D64]MEC4738633.1 DUF4177 domain-containing protein [Shewanella sp. E94]WBJ94932.1 DUF4177 domain-containing protein [Shewanella sp. MTB7]
MRKVVEFKQRKLWGFGEVDLEALNAQIDEVSKQGGELVSITPNSWFNGFVVSYTLLIECR